MSHISSAIKYELIVTWVEIFPIYIDLKTFSVSDITHCGVILMFHAYAISNYICEHWTV